MTARNLLASGLAGAMFALYAGALSAQPSEPQIDAVKQNCRSDFISHCRSVKPGGPEAIQCLKEKATSPGCKTALSALGGAPKPPAAAPQPAPPPPAASAPAPAPPPAPPASAAAPAPQHAPGRPATPPAPAQKPAPAPKSAATPPPPAAAPAAPAPAVTLTPPARPTLQQLKLVRDNCGTDIKVQCPDVPLGGGRILTCLAAKEPALSPGCKQTMLKISR